MTRKLMAATVVTLLGVTWLEARTFEVSAWRGETVAALVEDFAEVGEAPEGIGVKRAALADAAIRVPETETYKIQEGSFSMAKTPFQPAQPRPRDNPPHPEKKSM